MHTPRLELTARRVLNPFVTVRLRGHLRLVSLAMSVQVHTYRKKKDSFGIMHKGTGHRVYRDIRVSSDRKLGNASHYRTHARNSRKQRIALSMQRRCRIGRSDIILKSNTPRHLEDTARSTTHSELIEYVRTKHGVFLGGTA